MCQYIYSNNTNIFEMHHIIFHEIEMRTLTNTMYLIVACPILCVLEKLQYVQ